MKIPREQECMQTPYVCIILGVIFAVVNVTPFSKRIITKKWETEYVCIAAIPKINVNRKHAAENKNSSIYESRTFIIHFVNFYSN